MSSKVSSLRLVAVCAAFVAFASDALSQAASNSVLQSMSGKLSGTHRFIRWSNISSANPSKYLWSQSTLLPYELPGTRYGLEPIAPGYRATEGFYAMNADFGLTAWIAPTLSPLGANYAIKVLTFQTATMLNWPGGWTLEDYFNYDHGSYFDEDSADTGDMTDYNGNPNLLALSLLETDGGGLYRGGPILTYTTASGATGRRHATSWAMLNNGVRMENIGGGGEWSGTYYAFAWQWDLSDIAGPITRAEISTPLIVHSSTIGVQIDVSDTYTDALAQFPPPPPATPPALYPEEPGLTATPGDGSVWLSWPTRTNANGYNVKRSVVAGGPYATIATLPASATEYRDTGLSNGTTYYYVVSAFNAGGEGANSNQLAATPAIQPIAAWRQTHFNTSDNTGDAADDADPDGDGLSNLFEYALGLDPKLPDSHGAIVGGVNTAGRKLQITYAGGIADPGLVYVVEGTDDLASGVWTPIYKITGATNAAYHTGAPLSVEDDPLISAKTRRFLRLSVSTGNSTVKSAPYGFQKADLAAGTSSLGFPLLNTAAHTARVDGVAGSVLTLAGGTQIDLASRLSPDSAHPFYLEVISGPLEGERLDIDVAATIAADNGTVILSADLARNTLPSSRFAELEGNAIAIRRHLTLAQLQGVFANGLFGSDSSLSADSAYLFEAGAFVQYYLRANETAWRRGSSLPDRRYLPIPPGEGLQIRLRDADSLTQFGTVRTHAFRKNLAPGLQLAANPYPVELSPETLGARVDASQDAALRWVGVDSSTTADSLYVFSGGAFVQYYLRANGTTWRRTSGLTNYAAEKILKPTESFLIRRTNADSGYSVTFP